MATLSQMGFPQAKPGGFSGSLWGPWDRYIGPLPSCGRKRLVGRPPESIGVGAT